MFTACTICMYLNPTPFILLLYILHNTNLEYQMKDTKRLLNDRIFFFFFLTFLEFLSAELFESYILQRLGMLRNSGNLFVRKGLIKWINNHSPWLKENFDKVFDETLIVTTIKNFNQLWWNRTPSYFSSNFDGIELHPIFLQTLME